MWPKFIAWCEDPNPILVKETRQFLRSRLLLGVLFLEMCILSVITLFFLLEANENTSSSSTGRNFFGVLVFVLLFSLTLGAIEAMNRTRNERDPERHDLLFITALSPAQIVQGKFLAGMSVSILVVSLAAPFIVLSYLMRGVDLPMILSGLLLLFGFGALVVGVCQSLALVFSGGVVYKYGSVVGILVGTSSVGGLFVAMLQESASFSGGDIGWLLLCYLAALLYGLGLPYVTAKFLVSPTVADRSRPLRLALSLGWLGWVLALVALLTLGSHTLSSSIKEGAEIFALVMMWACVLIGLLLSMPARAFYARRWFRPPPRFDLFGFLFKEGLLNGLLWNGVLAALSWGVTGAVFLFGGITSSLSATEMHLLVWLPPIAFFYLAAYALTVRRLTDAFGGRYPWAAAPLPLFLSFNLAMWIVAILFIILDNIASHVNADHWPLVGNLYAVFIWSEHQLDNGYALFHFFTALGWTLWMVFAGLVAQRRGDRQETAQSSPPGYVPVPPPLPGE